MATTLRPSDRCIVCDHPTTGYLEIKDGQPEPVPVCNRCWKIRIDEDDLPEGTHPVVVDRYGD